MKKNKILNNPLKIICLIGFFLTLVISWGIVLSVVVWGRAESGRVQDTFTRSLREYDQFDGPKRVMEGENPEQIERLLSRLEKQASSVEEYLSVLKRRRALALIDRNYISAYADAAKEAAAKFAYSAPLAAVAAEAAVLGGTMPEETLALLKNYAGRITQGRFDMLNLSLHVLAGNLDNPAAAAALPELSQLLSSDLSALPPQIQRDLLVNEFLLLAYNGDIPVASYRLNLLLNETAPEITRMGAEFFYDFQNPLRAAELFLRLQEERDIARAAEALALAGEISGARNIWLALSSENPMTGQRANLAFDPDARFRIFYNLAASSTDKFEEEAWLERIFTSSRQGPLDSLGVYSTIRYTRLLDNERSIAVLDGIKGNPHIDLELLRRRLHDWPHTRSAAEVWLLLGRHDESENLHEWAAWYFEHQKLYTESGQLLKEAARKGIAGSWLDLHSSLALLREGKVSDAEKTLLASYSHPHSADWRISANLGRIQESRRAMSSALEYYENAAAKLGFSAPLRDRPSAAILQMRISRCLEALGRSAESLRALEAAYELDSSNINIRREYARRW